MYQNSKNGVFHYNAHPLNFWDSACSFCARTSGHGAHFCPNNTQTIGMVKSLKFKSGGAIEIDLFYEYTQGSPYSILIYITSITL